MVAVKKMLEDYDAEGLGKEFLQEEYIVQNRTLAELSSSIGVSMHVLRKALIFHNIVKTRAQCSQNISKANKGKNSPHSKESLQKAQKAAAESRFKNYTKKLAERGVTEESLTELYLNQNMSLQQLAKHFSVTKTNIRKWLNRFNIPPKSQEQRDEIRLQNFDDLYNDSERVAEIVQKTQTTIRERYGNKWYRTNASKGETELADSLAEMFPEYILNRGDYSVIHKGGSGGALQLDVYFPELNIAIEYNGDYWHDRELYEKDLENDTAFSREKMKDNLCKDKGIVLYHVWESDWKQNRTLVLQSLSSVIKDAGIELL